MKYCAKWLKIIKRLSLAIIDHLSIKLIGPYEQDFTYFKTIIGYFEEIFEDKAITLIKCRI